MEREREREWKKCVFKSWIRKTHEKEAKYKVEEEEEKMVYNVQICNIK